MRRLIRRILALFRRKRPVPAGERMLWAGILKTTDDERTIK